MIYNSSLLKQLPQILLYPLRSYSLFVLIIFSILLYILFAAFSPLAIFALIIIPSWFLKYAYAVLDHTIQGYDSPPEMGEEVWFFTNQRPLKQLFYMALIIIITFYTSPYFLILGVLLLPASAVIIATQNSLFMALNPLTLILFVKYIGYQYFIISVIFFLPLIALYLFIKSTGFILGLLSMTLLLYLIIMGFHALGFVVYHRRDILGLTVSVSPEREEAEQQEEKRQRLEKLLDEVYLLAGADKPKRALIVLFAGLGELNDDLDLNEYLFERFLLWQKKPVALGFGKHYINLLVRQKDFEKAFKVCRTCTDIDPKFQLDKPAAILPLATHAYQEHRHQLILQLTEKFEKLYPEHQDIIAVSFLRAKALTELGNLKEAIIIIKQLLEHKNHPLYIDIKKQAIFLMKLKR